VTLNSEFNKKNIFQIQNGGFGCKFLIMSKEKEEEFSFDHLDHFLQVYATLAEGSGL